MSRERYQRVKQVFLEVCDLPSGEREVALERTCGGDRSLRAEVESLLVSFDDSDADLSRVPGDDTPGTATRVGPYRILHEIGRGGMGVVYLARREDDQFRRLVAVKVLKRGVDTEDVLRRFDLERQVLAALNHPGIARLHDAGETEDGTPYFVMEHVEGLDILEYCDAHRLQLHERLRLFNKVCDAVHHAHQGLVVHRDLKPANILVTRNGEPKLLDFGIAKLLDPATASDDTAPTSRGERIMTPEYASPEQVRGEPVSTASDVYALGVLLYQIVCGHAPYRFPGRAPAEIERVVCEEEPPRPSTTVGRPRTGDARDAATEPESTVTRESVSRARDTRPERLRRALEGDIDNIAMMALHKTPQRRYASAQALAEDLERHLDQHPVVARAPALGYRMNRFVRRHRVGAAAAVVATLVLASGAAATISGWLEAGTRRDEAFAAEAVATDLQVRATEARTRAEHRLGQVRELARAFVFDFHELVRDIDDTGAARRLMVETAQQYLRELAADVEGNEPLALELATLHDQVGDIQGGGRGPTLDDHAGAAASYEAGLALRTQVLAAAPGDATARAAVATSHARLGALAQRAGDAPAALDAHRQALEIREALLAEVATNDHRRAVAMSLAALAATLLETGDVAAAVEHDERALAMRRAVLAVAPDDRAARELSAACIVAAARLTDVGWHENAVRCAEEAVRVMEPVTRTGAEPGQGEQHRLDLVLVLAPAAVARARLAAPGPPPPTDDLVAALALAMDAASTTPTADAQLELAETQRLLGLANARHERWTEAIRDLEAAHTLVAALAEAEPTRPLHRRRLARVNECLGDVRAAAGNTEAGVAQLQQAAAAYLELAETDPRDDPRDVPRCLARLGHWHHVAGRDVEAMDVLVQARARFVPLRESRPDDRAVRDDLVRTLQELSRVAAELGSDATAAQYAREAAAGGE